MIVAEIISSLTMLLAAITFAVGVDAWRREHIGKRKADLGEETLALFYEARDCINSIRSPLSYEGEGSSRKKNPHETEEESKAKERAYVPFTRYEKCKEVFNKLNAIRYRFMAQFGEASGVSFIEVKKVVNEIMTAASILGEHYWVPYATVGLDAKEKKLHREQRKKFEDIFWHTGESDEIEERINLAIVKIEKFVEEAMNDSYSSFGFLLKPITRKNRR